MPDTGFLDRTVELGGRAVAFQVYVPRSYDAGRRWPVVLALHGSGERGSDGLLQTGIGVGTAIRSDRDRWPAVVVFPQAPRGATWRGTSSEIALGALARTEDELSIDPDRRYLTGLSLGGNGCWYLACHHPDVFAALAVVCGGVEGDRDGESVIGGGRDTAPARVARRIRRIPTWIVHGSEDTVIPVEDSRRMAAALADAGADVTYEEVPNLRHDSWDHAYQESEMVEWMLRQRRESTEGGTGR